MNTSYSGVRNPEKFYPGDGYFRTYDQRNFLTGTKSGRWTGSGYKHSYGARIINDANGRKIAMLNLIFTSSYPNGQPADSIVYEYDGQGNLILERKYDLKKGANKAQLVQTDSATFIDNKPNYYCTKLLRDGVVKPQYHGFYRYDAMGNCTSFYMFNEFYTTGMIEYSRDSAAYNINGQRIYFRREYFDSTRSSWNKSAEQLVFYSVNGRVDSLFEYGRSGSGYGLQGAMRYKYDDLKRTIAERNSTNPGPDDHSAILTFNEWGLLISKDHSPSSVHSPYLPPSISYYYYSVDTISDHTEKDKPKIIVYPNPANEYIWLEAELEAGKYVAAIKVFDVLGRMVARKTTEFATSVKMNIQTGHFQSGVYFVQADLPEIKYRNTFKIAVKH